MVDDNFPTELDLDYSRLFEKEIVEENSAKGRQDHGEQVDLWDRGYTRAQFGRSYLAAENILVVDHLVRLENRNRL